MVTLMKQKYDRITRLHSRRHRAYWSQTSVWHQCDQTRSGGVEIKKCTLSPFRIHRLDDSHSANSPLEQLFKVSGIQLLGRDVRKITLQ